MTVTMSETWWSKGQFIISEGTQISNESVYILRWVSLIWHELWKSCFPDKATLHFLTLKLSPWSVEEVLAWSSPCWSIWVSVLELRVAPSLQSSANLVSHKPLSSALISEKQMLKRRGLRTETWETLLVTYFCVWKRCLQPLECRFYQWTRWVSSR